MFSCTNDPVAPKDNKTTVVASEQDSDPNTSNPPIKP